MPPDKLDQLLRSVEPAVLNVEPRILRRIIRLDRRMQGLRLLVSRHATYTIDRDRLLAFAEPSELGMASAAHLPERVVLLSKSDSDAESEAPSTRAPQLAYARRLFRACVQLDVENRLSQNSDPQPLSAERCRQIGEVEFAEIRAVLLKDDQLFQPASDLEAYVAFAALYLELRYFAPDELAWYFPAVRDWQNIDRVVSQDIDHQQLFERFQYYGETELSEREPAEEQPTGTLATATAAPVSLAVFRELQMQAEKSAAIGNNVKAALSHWHATQVAPRGYEAEVERAAREELLRLAQRLQQALQLPDEETDRWAIALQSLLAPAGEGSWSNEACLLYDLQKVCVEAERTIRRHNLVEWIVTLGKRPFDRPLPLLRDALMLRHLRTASQRVAGAQLSLLHRQRLATLLEGALEDFETRSRDSLREHISGVFDDVGLAAHNVPEQVARRKVIDELIDQILERSYLSMADLRDALSKNDLKLPDVTTVSQLVEGDRLLRADRKLDTVLDGVYRRGAVYQRWPQMLSSLAFGTRFGRFVTQYLVIPYGGAFLTLECLRYLAAFLHSPETSGLMPSEPPAGAEQHPIDWFFVATVLILGTWISRLIHRPAFLAWNVSLLKQFGQFARRMVVDLPASVFRSQYVQQVIASRAFTVVRNYLLQPALFTGLLWIVSRMAGNAWSNRLLLEVFLLAALFFNSALGKYTVEVATELLMRMWHELRMRVFAALVQWIMDLFRGLLSAMERAVYTIDEWLRFRTGDERAIQGFKLAGGVFWFFAAYIVIFVFTLLVEPQINPIKHFPVVTVSHKLILPAGPAIVQQLTPYLGAPLANTVVWTTIWMIPGVCGFLVWELKENWRLYAANRPATLRSASIGAHGETMMQLLRPGFHSGTLPKAFAALRRAARKGDSLDSNRLRRRLTTIRRVEAAVRRFVERELIELLKEIRFLNDTPITVGEIRTSTNRIDVELACQARPGHSAVLTWTYLGGNLAGSIDTMGWIDGLEEKDRRDLTTAVAGLLQRGGIDNLSRVLPADVPSILTWNAWVDLWQSANTLRETRTA